MKKTEILWGASLAAIGVCTLAVCINAISEYKLPILATRIFGVIIILCIPALVFLTVKMVINNHKKQ